MRPQEKEGGEEERQEEVLPQDPLCVWMDVSESIRASAWGCMHPRMHACERIERGLPRDGRRSRQRLLW